MSSWISSRRRCGHFTIQAAHPSYIGMINTDRWAPDFSACNIPHAEGALPRKTFFEIADPVADRPDRPGLLASGQCADPGRRPCRAGVQLHPALDAVSRARRGGSGPLSVGRQLAHPPPAFRRHALDGLWLVVPDRAAGKSGCRRPAADRRDQGYRVRSRQKGLHAEFRPRRFGDGDGQAGRSGSCRARRRLFRRHARRTCPSRRCAPCTPTRPIPTSPASPGASRTARAGAKSPVLSFPGAHGRRSSGPGALSPSRHNLSAPDMVFSHFQP